MHKEHLEHHKPSGKNLRPVARIQHKTRWKVTYMERNVSNMNCVVCSQWWERTAHLRSSRCPLCVSRSSATGATFQKTRWQHLAQAGSAMPLARRWICLSRRARAKIEGLSNPRTILQKSSYGLRCLSRSNATSKPLARWTLRRLELRARHRHNNSARRPSFVRKRVGSFSGGREAPLLREGLDTQRLEG